MLSSYASEDTQTGMQPNALRAFHMKASPNLERKIGPYLGPKAPSLTRLLGRRLRRIAGYANEHQREHRKDVDTHGGILSSSWAWREPA
jgi:hypothetical protein